MTEDRRRFFRLLIDAQCIIGFGQAVQGFRHMGGRLIVIHH